MSFTIAESTNMIARILFSLSVVYLSFLFMMTGYVSSSDSVLAQFTASTTLTLSVCGNSIVDDGEECEPPGTGLYSQTIVGRQCDPECNFGPYCGDGILQTQFDEECDDGNNEDGDFCSAICKIEPAGSGGGGSSGGNTGGSGGSNDDLGDTQINVRGLGYPSRTITFLIDTEQVGSVQADNDGDFEFAAEVSPGTATLGIWSTDDAGTRSVTLNNTFDVTQGAITNINGVVVPPTIRVASQNVDPGAVVLVEGQAVPDATIELHVNTSDLILETTSDDAGDWSIELDTSQLTIAEHILRARSITGNPPLTTESSFSTSLQLFVGVDGQASTPSDLNRDGFVNLIDFSILIFWWQTSGGNSDPPADINGNGVVSLEDFSILLFNWTG
jgi:cysteine-rich repeat protein